MAAAFRSRERRLFAGLLAVLVVGLAWALTPAKAPRPPEAEPTGAASPPATSPRPTTSAAPAAITSAAPPPPPTETTLQVLDAGASSGQLRAAVSTLKRLGYQVVATAPSRLDVAHTTVWFTPGNEPKAKALHLRDPRFAEVSSNKGFSSDVDLHVLIGPDWR